jgi:ADP-ribose pyrophosphatase YjhB (NUDIX family)
MPEPRLEFAQKAFIMDQGKILLVRKADTDPHFPGFWEVPGGRLQVRADGDLDEHIRREVKEEVGLNVDPGPPFHLWEWWMPEAGADIRVVAVARTFTPAGSTEFSTTHRVADDHLSDAAWVSVRDLGDYPLIPSLKPVMDQFRHHQG